MNYYNEIKKKIINNEIYLKVKDYSKERNTVITYFEIGKLLYEAGSKYGESIIEKYSNKLMNEVGKKYNKRTLFRMRQFYKVFSNEKVSPLGTQLTWSHYRELLSFDDIEKIKYYINQCINHNLSKRQLIEKIKNNPKDLNEQNNGLCIEHIEKALQKLCPLQKNINRRNYMEKIYFKSYDYEIRKKEKLKQLKEELNNKYIYKQIHMINNDEK